MKYSIKNVFYVTYNKRLKWNKDIEKANSAKFKPQVSFFIFTLGQELNTFIQTFVHDYCQSD